MRVLVLWGVVWRGEIKLEEGEVELGEELGGGKERVTEEC